MWLNSREKKLAFRHLIDAWGSQTAYKSNPTYIIELGDAKLTEFCDRLIRSLRLNEQLAKRHFLAPYHCPHFRWGFWFSLVSNQNNKKLSTVKKINWMRSCKDATFNLMNRPNLYFNNPFFTSAPTNVQRITEQLNFFNCSIVCFAKEKQRRTFLSACWIYLRR